MKIEIDTDKVIEKAISNLVEGDILKEVVDDSRIGDIVDDVFSKDEIKDKISDKVCKIIDEYLDSEDGKEYILDALRNQIDNSDVLSDDKITELLAEFVKKKLE